MNEPRRLYTVARANKALPLVARIVDDVVSRAQELRRLGQAKRSARCEALETIERELVETERELERHAQELAALGVEVKDPMKGLIDFPARAGERAIYLCWMKGEEKVAWWHPIESGFNGRRPISELPIDLQGD